MKRGAESISSNSQTTCNLTKYNEIFNRLDPEFDILNIPKNPIEKTKNTYTKAKAFLDSLKAHIGEYPELSNIISALNDLNEFAADLIAIQTKGHIKLNELVEAKDRVRCHFLAEVQLDDVENFIQSIQTIVKDIEAVLRQKTYLDPQAKLDDVDNQLLQSETIALPMEARLGPGTVNINVKTHRSNLSLFTNGFNNAKDPHSKEMVKILKTLNNFIRAVQVNDYNMSIYVVAQLTLAVDQRQSNAEDAGQPTKKMRK